MNPAMIALIVVALGVVTLVAVDMLGIGGGVGDERWATGIAMAALLLAISGGALSRYRGRFGMAATHIAIWLAIALVIGLLYTWREPLMSAFGA